MKKKGLSAAKAKQILKDGYVKGKPLTEKQKKFFGSIADGATPLKKINGGWLDKYQDGGNTKSKSFYNLVLDKALKDKKGTLAQWNRLKDIIAYHESKSDATAVQTGGGPGRGLYQFEPNSLKTTGQRAINYGKINNIEVPSYIIDISKGKLKDASKLTEEQQNELLLVDYLQKPNADLGKYFSGEQSEVDFWLKGHWGGEKAQGAEAAEKRRKSFIRDLKQYNKLYPEIENKGVIEDEQFKNGGWLDKYNDGGSVQPNYNDSNVSLPPGFKGWGYDNSPSGYNPAWNGPVAQNGLELNKKYIDSTLNANMDKRWVQRLYEKNPEFYLEGETEPSTHFMESGDGYVYPRVMEGDDKQLKAVSREEGRAQGIKFPNDKIAQWFAKNYKKGTNVLKEYQMGGSLPGATGMMYARTSGTSPEEPTQAKNGGRCWPGYKAVAGKTPFSKGSCQKAQNGRATLSQYKEPAWYEKAADYLASPMTALSYIVQGKDLPDRLPINVENRNPYDMAVDMINPAAWYAYAESADRNMSEGNYIDATFDALSAIPVIPAWLSKGKNVTKAGKNAIKKTAKSKSQIDWGKWNKEIPENKALMKEYEAIEQQAKIDGTWMKNSDGSPFKGTPEQFVQQNSKNFKKAYPKGFDETYRGDNRHYPELRSKDHPFYNKPIFTANEDLAADYASKRMGDYYNPNIKTAEQKLKERLKKGVDIEKFRKINPGLASNYQMTTKGGTHHLAIPKTDNVIIMDAQERGWRELNDRILYNEMSENIQRRNFPGEFSTDDLAEHIFDKGIDRAHIFNVHDGGFGNVLIHNQKPGNYAKSLRGNNGMFDMTNPNVYKAIVPGAIGVGAASQMTGPVREDGQFKNGGWLDKFQEGGVIEDNRGQWAYPGEVTKINSNNITMQGVPYPVLGISDTGDMQLMQPEGEYKFKGNNVTEFPMAQKGKTITVNSKNDPRYKAYQDSLKLSNTEKKMYESESGVSYDHLLSTPPFSTSPSYGYTESGKPLYGYKPKQEVIVKKSRPKQQSVTTLKSKDIVQPEMSVEDFDMYVPVVDYWNVTKEVNQNFGGRKSTFKVKDEAELERLKRQQEIDEQTTTGKNNKLIIIPNYDSGRMKKVNISAKNGSLVALNQLTNFTNYNTPQPGGWLDKY